MEFMMFQISLGLAKLSIIDEDFTDQPYCRKFVKVIQFTTCITEDVKKYFENVVVSKNFF